MKDIFHKRSKAKILVVEDNPAIQMVTRMSLERTGFSVDVASNSQEALAYFGKGETYDLVILDIGLPDLDGREVCKIMRKRQDKHIPIIAYTACDTFIENCYKAGIDDFIVKPVLNQRFKQLLEKWLPHKCFKN